jgi:hypothetical protein
MTMSLEDWRRNAKEREADRQRGRVELRNREAETRKERQPDWSAFWETIDQRIAAVVETQDDLLVAIVKEARDTTRAEIVKAIGDVQTAVDARLEALERRVRAPGVLPPIKVWDPRAIFYAGELVTFDGSVFQALANTGVRPDDKEFWICIARAGTDALGITPRGQWSATASYELLSLVTYQGGSYLATRNDPGEPGDGRGGWQIIASRGAKGDPGPRGPRGNRGARGTAETPVTIVGWALDVENYRACPALSNGEVGAILDLRPLFAQFHDETERA